MDEVDVDPIDLGNELGERVELRLARAPVVLGRPVAGQLLDGRQLHALRTIGDELLRGQPPELDAPSEVVQGPLRDVDLEGADVGVSHYDSSRAGLPESRPTSAS